MQENNAGEHPNDSPARRPSLAPWAAAGSAGAILLVVVAVLIGGREVYQVLGNSYPGAFTSFGVALLQTAADVSAAVCLGALVFCAFFTSPQQSGRVSVDGYAALRTSNKAAWVWFGVSVLLIPFEMADSSGLALGRVLPPENFVGLLDALYQPKAWIATAIVALVVAVSSHLVLSWRPTFLLAAVAAVGPLAPAVVGHSSSNAGHDYATNAIVIHVLAATLWLGVLVAVALHVRRGGGRTSLVLARYRKLAMACWIILAASGAVDALVLVPPTQLLNTDYGVMVLLTVALLVLLGIVGMYARRRMARSTTSARLAVRLLGTELVIMLLTMGVSVALTHTPPPSLLSQNVNPSDEIIGYDLPNAPSALNLLTTWRFDLILGTAAVVLAALYLVGVWKLRRRGESWPIGRTVAWLCGCASVVIATSSGLGVYSSAVLSLHMLVHMVLNMFSPVLLVLGGPLTLALRLLPVGENAGPREWLLAAIRSPLARVLAHPAVATVLFVGSFYLLYFTDLFEQAMTEHWAHELMKALFLVIGYLYYWTVIGIDPTPKPLPHLARLGMVFAAMPFHSVFGVIVLSTRSVIAENFYRQLNFPWAPDLLSDQHLAGGIAWGVGEVPLALVLIALLIQWYRHDMREGSPDRSGNEDRSAYNAMLDKLAETRR